MESEAYTQLLNQATALRVIADRAAAVAIGEMDLSTLTEDDCALIDQYLTQTGYQDDDADNKELDFITGVIKPLLMSVPSTVRAGQTSAASVESLDGSGSNPGSGSVSLPPLVDYVSLSQRELSRKQRMRDELSQLKILRELDTLRLPSNLSDTVRNAINAELEASRTALLFASSDALERPLLMSLSPSVRIAEKITKESLEQAGRDANNPAEAVDWSDVEAA